MKLLSFRQLHLTLHESSWKWQFFNFIIRSTACILYTIALMHEDGTHTRMSQIRNESKEDFFWFFHMKGEENIIWRKIFYVSHPLWINVAQTIISVMIVLQLLPGLIEVISMTLLADRRRYKAEKKFQKYLEKHLENRENVDIDSERHQEFVALMRRRCNTTEGIRDFNEEINNSKQLGSNEQMSLTKFQQIIFSLKHLKQKIYVLRYWKRYILMDIICTYPWLFMWVDGSEKHLFIPAFLNCWMAKWHLENALIDFDQKHVEPISAVSQQCVSVVMTVFCIIFTTTCGFHQLQRASTKNVVSLLNAFYWTLVTFSTVGYGDITPDIWVSKLFVSCMIVVAVLVTPLKIEKLINLLREERSRGRGVNTSELLYHPHVVVIIPILKLEQVEKFITEFFNGYEIHSTFRIVFLCKSPISSALRIILNTPKWSESLIWTTGSAFSEKDLERVSLKEAKAVFILPSTGIIGVDKDQADRHTIMRSWAVREFAPTVPQHIHLFRAENRIHICYVEHLMCEDEMKYALLASNCLCCGIGSYLAILAHDSIARRAIGDVKMNKYLSNINLKNNKDILLKKSVEIYSRSITNNLYRTTINQSPIFSQFVHLSFSYAALLLHKQYDIALIAIEDTNGQLILNPSKMKLKDDSIVYYIGKKDADSIHIREDKKHTNCLNDTLRLSPSNNNFIATQLFEKKQAKDWKTVLAQRQNVSILTDALIHQVRNLHQKEETIQKQHQNLMQLPSTFIQSISREYLNEEKVSFNSSTSKMREDFRMDLIQSCIERSRSLEENTEIKNISIDHMNLNIKTCHMMKQRRHICCTKLGSLCEHRIDVKLFMKYCETDYADILSNNSNHRIILKQLEELIPFEIRTYKSYGWKYNSILLINSRCGSAIFNLLFPLRAASLSKETLRPIILILERPPTNYFLRIISQLPMVYWNYGSIRDMEILLESGILDTQTIIVLPEDRSQLVHESIEHIVEDRSMEIRKWNEDKIPENFLHLENRLLHVEQLLRTINRRITFGNLDDILSTLSHLRQEHNDSHHGDSDDPYQEECLKDVKNILGIQTLLQRFPHLNIVTELRNPMNMRFLNSSSNLFSRLLEKQEKIHYDSHNYMKYLWKAPFVSGKVYSTVMLESFLYRSFEKQYLISLIRLLLDLDHNEHSANLTSIIVKEVDAANCYYSQLFTHLVMNEGTIPIGLCRRIVDNNDNQILRKSVSIPHNSYKNEKLNEFDIQFSYEYRGDLSSLVLVNPPSNTQLIEGDVIFILKATDRDMEKERGESYLPNKNN